MTRSTVPRRRRLLSASVFCLSALACPALAQSTSEAGIDGARRVEQLLAAPPSPEAEVLLIDGAADPRVAARWTSSLAHRDPRVRGAAARAIRVALRRDLRPAIEKALLAENDALAASEHADALIELAGFAHPAALAAVRRLPDPLSTTVVLTVMRVAPMAVASVPSDVWPVTGHDDAVGDALGDLAASRPAVASALAAQLIAVDAPLAWPVWRRAFPPDTTIPAVHLATALASPRSEVREGALTEVLTQRLARPEPPRLDAPLAAAIEAERGLPTSATGRLVREVLARTLGSPLASRSALEALLVEVAPSPELTELLHQARAWLTEAERSALASRGRRKVTGKLAGTDATPRLVSVADLPPGVLAGLLRGADCPARRLGVAVGVVDYNERGRPSTIVVPESLGDTCRSRVITLLRLGATMRPGARTVIVPLEPPDGFATRSSTAVSNTERLRPDDGDVAPRVRRTVKPDYTDAAMKALVQGSVLMSVVIDENGRVIEVEVLEVLHPELNLQALRAMLRWEFHPGMRRGTPVPMRAVTQMEFSLR